MEAQALDHSETLFWMASTSTLKEEAAPATLLSSAKFALMPGMPTKSELLGNKWAAKHLNRILLDTTSLVPHNVSM